MGSGVAPLGTTVGKEVLILTGLGVGPPICPKKASAPEPYPSPTPSLPHTGLFPLYRVTRSLFGLAVNKDTYPGKLETAHSSCQGPWPEVSCPPRYPDVFSASLSRKDPCSVGVCLLPRPTYLGTDVLKGGWAHQGEADQKDILQREGQIELTKGCPCS